MENRLILKRIAKGSNRNRRCFCGSDKKYKNCHYLIDSEANEISKDKYRAERENIKSLTIK